VRACPCLIVWAARDASEVEKMEFARAAWSAHWRYLSNEDDPANAAKIVFDACKYVDGDGGECPLCLIPRLTLTLPHHHARLAACQLVDCLTCKSLIPALSLQMLVLSELQFSGGNGQETMVLVLVTALV
jgi:hypothetical protein